MSVTSEITRLQNAKASLKTAIEGKGVTVSSSTKLDGYADLVDSISGGSIEDLITKENLVRIKVNFGDSHSYYTFTLDASNNFTDESSDPSLLNTDLESIKLIFADLELDYYTVYRASRGDNARNFLVISGVEFSFLYTLTTSGDIYFTLYRNNERIGYLKARED